jgi:hypothetical protein
MVWSRGGGFFEVRAEFCYGRRALGGGRDFVITGKRWGGWASVARAGTGRWWGTVAGEVGCGRGAFAIVGLDGW